MMVSKTRQTLYLCYFGLREPLVQTQVLPYLREIAKDDFKVHLLTFESNFRVTWNAGQIAEEKRKLANEGISWECLAYHKSPSVPATLYDVFAGARYARRMIRKEGISILHARAHVPVLMALAARLSNSSCKVIFDIRGLVAEEYADAGVWDENSAGFRFIKKIETLGLKRADRIIVLTGRMKNYLIENKLKTSDKITVIPCCVDFSRTSNESKEPVKNERFELIYAGSVIGLYLLEEMGRFFIELRKREKNAFFRVLTSTPDAVSEVFSKLGIEARDFEAAFVNPAEILFHISKARLAISFRKPTFSQMAASPTKIPEYLAVGVPVITNAGIGDMDAVIEKENVGVVVKNFDTASLSEAVNAAFTLLEQEKIADRCISAANEKFDLVNVGGRAYRELYKSMFD